MNLILEKLTGQKRRDSTVKIYQSIWRQFNNFIIRLDRKPVSWEDGASLFGAHLVEVKKLQSQTVRSYISAIKGILVDDGYNWDDNKVLLSTLTKACKLINDQVRTRLPIQKGLLEVILFEIQRDFRKNNQHYLEILYKTIFCVAYYRMFRIGELTTGKHPVKARDVHVAKNKQKLLFVLYSSKTHNLGSRPQKIKITSNNSKKERKCFFCPFELTRQYLQLRGDYQDETEPFFIFRDQQPVTPQHCRKVLKSALLAVNLNPKLYSCHGMRAGHASDLILQKKSISFVKMAGRWRSNIVFKYIRNFQ